MRAHCTEIISDKQMYGEAGTEDIYDSFATRVRVRDKQDLCYNEDIYQTIFPPKQPRLSLADISFGGTGKNVPRNLFDQKFFTQNL